jgi:hypothetical protein
MSFYNIKREEMHAFLTGQGFQAMNIPGTVELVYGKIVNHDGHKLSLRVYTAINPSGESRKKGSDAIRIQLYWMFDGKPVPVGKAQKCLRVTTWRKNMTAAIAAHAAPENFKTCPACGSPLVQRENGKTGEEFWGCSTWIKTKCNGKAKPVDTSNIGPKIGNSPLAPRQDFKLPEVSPSDFKPKAAPKPFDPMAKFRIPDHQISSHQLAVQEYFTTDTGNIIMGARAGSGKTTMLKHLASFRKTGKSMVYLAFGKKNANEGKKKLPREVVCCTTHSFCGRWLRENFKMPEKSDESKNWRLMEEIYPGMSNKDRRRIRKAAFRLIGLGKNFGIHPGNIAGLKSVMEQYSFELESEAEVMTALEVANEVLEKSLPKSGLAYDYDDMLWWPLVLGLEPPKYDTVLADECQDFNACQIDLLRKMEARGSRIVAVGDPYQAVFRFRGADCDAYDKLKAMLSVTTRGCKELILPTNYRCCKAIIDHVRERTVVKDIEAAPNAIEGKVIEDMSYLDILDMLVAEHSVAA